MLLMLLLRRRSRSRRCRLGLVRSARRIHGGRSRRRRRRLCHSMGAKCGSDEGIRRVERLRACGREICRQGEVIARGAAESWSLLRLLAAKAADVVDAVGAVSGERELRRRQQPMISTHGAADRPTGAGIVRMRRADWWPCQPGRWLSDSWPLSTGERGQPARKRAQHAVMHVLYNNGGGQLAALQIVSTGSLFFVHLCPRIRPPSPH